MTAAALAGCATSENEYSGATLPASQVATVEVGKTDVFDGTTPLAVLQIDDKQHFAMVDQMVPFATQQFAVLPGSHQFVLGVQQGGGFLGQPAQEARYSVSANLEAGKRYKFIGKVKYSGVGLLASALAGSVLADIKLVNVTDGVTASCDGSPAYCALPLPDNQQIGAEPGTDTSPDAPPVTSQDQAPTVSTDPPAATTFDRWEKAHPSKSPSPSN